MNVDGAQVAAKQRKGDTPGEAAWANVDPSERTMNILRYPFMIDADEIKT